MLHCHAPSVKGLVLGLVGQESVYCDWVKKQIWSPKFTIFQL